MSRKHFSWLLMVSVVVAVTALMLPDRTGQQQSLESDSLLPGLQSQVNQLDWLRVRGAGDKVLATLVRDDDQWTVEEVHGYRADWGRLQPLLSGLASAEIIELKTANAAYYDRLGVENVSSGNAAGYQVEFAADTGLPAVIIGNTAQARGGQYVRIQGSEQSVLVDSRFELPSTRQGWLDRDIVDIGDAEVVEVEIIHPDGERIMARKASADDDNFMLEGIPDGRKVKSDWTVNSLAGSFAALTLEGVAPEGEIDWSGATKVRLLTADGLNAEAEIVGVKAEDGATDDSTAPAEYWLRLQSGLYTTAVGSAVDSGGSDETAARAKAINERVSGWAYRLPPYKFKSMNKRMDDLLQAVEPSS
jgi:hypothetical protein